MNQKEEIISFLNKKIKKGATYHYQYCTESSDIINKLFISWDLDPEMNTDVELHIDKETHEIISIKVYSFLKETRGFFIYNTLAAKKLITRFMNEAK